MKTLSVKQPWATLICSGIKDVENRSWKPNEVPGRILIHAGSTKISSKTFEGIPEEIFSNVFNSECLGNLPELESLPTGAIIGYVTVSGFEDGKMETVWADGQGVIKWKLEDAWMFDEPILNVKGNLNLWDYDLDESNLPPAHQVDLEFIDINDAEDEVFIPCDEESFKQIGAGEYNSVKLYLISDLIDLLCVSNGGLDMKPFKTVTLSYGDRYMRFELTDESGIYDVPDPDDETQPYIIQYHDGVEGAWMTAEFVLGKKLDEGELVSICGGLTINELE